MFYIVLGRIQFLNSPSYMHDAGCFSTMDTASSPNYDIDWILILVVTLKPIGLLAFSQLMAGSDRNFQNFRLILNTIVSADFAKPMTVSTF